MNRNHFLSDVIQIKQKTKTILEWKSAKLALYPTGEGACVCVCVCVLGGGGGGGGSSTVLVYTTGSLANYLKNSPTGWGCFQLAWPVYPLPSSMSLSVSVLCSICTVTCLFFLFTFTFLLAQLFKPPPTPSASAGCMHNTLMTWANSEDSGCGIVLGFRQLSSPLSVRVVSSASSPSEASILQPTPKKRSCVLQTYT